MELGPLNTRFENQNRVPSADEPHSPSMEFTLSVLSSEPTNLEKSNCTRRVKRAKPASQNKNHGTSNALNANHNCT